MIRCCKITIISLIAGFSLSVSAFSLDTNLLYFSDTFDNTAENSNTFTFGDFAININLGRKGKYTVGWNYGIVQISETNGPNEISFSVTEMGPIFNWYFNRAQTWVFYFVYNLIATADVEQGGASSEWRGTTMRAGVGFLPQLTDHLFIGLKINYYIASFEESFDASNTFSEIDSSRTIIYPTISLTYKFK